MSGFPIVDLVVGIIFVFFLASIVCSSVVEMAMQAYRVRATVLEQWVTTIFNTDMVNKTGLKANNKEDTMGWQILKHCVLTGLSDAVKTPSYIDAKNFAIALVDKIVTHSTTTTVVDIDSMISAINTSSAISDELKHTFLLFANEAKDALATAEKKTIGAIEAFNGKIENWYDSNMDRLTGTMKQKYTRKFTLIAGIVITLALNVDTVGIARYLYNNPEARVQLAQKAIESTQDSTMKAQVARVQASPGVPDSVKLTVEQLSDSLTSRKKAIATAYETLKGTVPLGWSRAEFKTQEDTLDWIFFIAAKLAGLAVTVFAVMMGAPFWFDMLNKVSNLRSTGTKPQSTTDK